MTFIALVVLAAFLFTAFSRITRLEARIDVLEAGRTATQGTSGVAVASSHAKSVAEVWVAPVYEKTEPARAGAPDNIPAVEIHHSPTWVAPVGVASTEAVSTTEHVNATTTVPQQTESSLGGTWFTTIGALALIIAGAFFFRYAVDNGWFS